MINLNPISQDLHLEDRTRVQGLSWKEGRKGGRNGSDPTSLISLEIMRALVADEEKKRQAFADRRRLRMRPPYAIVIKVWTRCDQGVEF